jgi:hypothetical protein
MKVELEEPRIIVRMIPIIALKSPDPLADLSLVERVNYRSTRQVLTTVGSGIKIKILICIEAQ